MIHDAIPEMRTENLPEFKGQESNGRVFVRIDKYIVNNYEPQHVVAQIISSVANLLKEATGFVTGCAKYIFGERSIHVPAAGQVLSSALSAFTGLNL